MSRFYHDFLAKQGFLEGGAGLDGPQGFLSPVSSYLFVVEFRSR
jgi:hypothetical protein